eukprot:g38667.t1
MVLPLGLKEAGCDLNAPTLLGSASGPLPVEAQVQRDATGGVEAISATSYRTQRRIMEGAVLVPADLFAN